MSGVRIGGAWKTPAVVSVKIGGVWKTASSVSCKIGGVWKTTTLGSAPATPTLSHTAAGQFTITNYDSSLVYTLALVSGSGTATRVGAVVTLSATTARFSITAAYASGAPVSGFGYMQRTPYTYTQVASLGGEGVGFYYTTAGDPCSPPTWMPEELEPGNWLCRRYDPVKDATPSGYTDAYGEWARVT
jgi:hypothetical protein